MIHLDTVEAAEKVASDLAHFIFEHPVGWQLPFVLARKLKRFGGEPENYAEVVQRFCLLIEERYDDFFPVFIDSWDRVKFIDTGTDTFALATEQADAIPIDLPPTLRPPTQSYSHVYSLCFYLAIHTAPHPFCLPQPRIVDWLSLNKNTVSAIVRWLCAKGVLECVDHSYSFGSGKNKAKKYRILT